MCPFASSLHRDMLRFIPLITLMGVIFYLSHQAGNSLRLPEIVGLDKLLHALVYGLLAITAFIAVRPWRSRVSKSWLAFAVVVFCFLYGVSDEFHQSFIPNRYVSGWDVVADTLGAAVVALIWGLKFEREEQ